MKALSIKQPWAFAIMRMGKNIENRNWKTKYRGEFLVHAAKGIDAGAPDDLIKAYARAVAAKDKATMTGGLLGTVELKDVVDKSRSKWFRGKYGFVLDKPKDLMQFIPMKGQLNFFNVEVTSGYTGKFICQQPFEVKENL